MFVCLFYIHHTHVIFIPRLICMQVLALDPKAPSNEYASAPLAQLERLISTERGLEMLSQVFSVLPHEVQSARFKTTNANAFM